jgi:hypothetical protein
MCHPPTFLDGPDMAQDSNAPGDAWAVPTTRLN